MDAVETVRVGEEVFAALEPLLAHVGDLRTAGSLSKIAAALRSPQVENSLVRAFDAPGTASAQELGNKGSWLARLTKLGAPVPPGFTISTRAASSAGEISPQLWTQIGGSIKGLEHKTGQGFGDAHNPLVVSVRSGAAVSMPGMMDTVLNVGINGKVVESLAKTGTPEFAWGTYSRFLRSYGETVRGIPHAAFHAASLTEPGGANVVTALERQSSRYRRIIEEASGPVPDEPGQQLHESVSAVFKSWNNPRAVTYRQLHGIPDNPGTAVTVQKMVFGNQVESGAGIALSHNATTGARRLSGEWLPGAQDELVSGELTPLSISRLRDQHPEAYSKLASLVGRIQRHVGQPLEFEFTVERNQLYVLQARAQRLTPEATVKRAMQEVETGATTPADALSRITPAQLEAVQLPRFKDASLKKAHELASGLAASPGAAVGRIVRSSTEAVAAAGRGESVILVRDKTLPDDLDGMLAAKAIVTRLGGTTSQAAIVALEQGKPCVTGCEDLSGLEGIVSVNGFTGRVYKGALPMERLHHAPAVEKYLQLVSDAEAKKWPPPRFTTNVERGTELAPEAANYYLTRQMTHALRATTLFPEADKLRIETNVSLAERMASMMFSGVEWELRSFPEANLQYTPELKSDADVLSHEFGLKFNPYSKAEHESVVAEVAGSSPERQQRFLNAASNLFGKGVWGNGTEWMDDRYHVYGGRSWEKISTSLGKFLKGDLSHSLFVDHAFDLYHNKGSFFESVMGVLDTKRDARSLEELYTNLSGLDLHPDVRSLYDKGTKLNLW